MAGSPILAYKAYEIEEFVDIYFYRRAGYQVALLARAGRLSPNALSVLAGIVGALGGAFIAWPHLAWTGVGLLVLHGIIDSADGQLARLTGQTSEFGRVLDGLAGYATHIALYLGLVATVRETWGLGSALAAALASGVCTALQAQMYDYHRTAFAGYAIKGRIPTELTTPEVRGPLAAVVSAYAATQRALLGRHRAVEAAIASRSMGGFVAAADREAYRACFKRGIGGWNLLGDNVRRYAIAGCVFVGHPAWFMPITMGPLNLVLFVMWAHQQAADRRFLAARGGASVHVRET
ncbi:MAG: CDP-alcohol phosphatidyltransferase family protein [Vicinamibacterales bacterium]